MDDKRLALSFYGRQIRIIQDGFYNSPATDDTNDDFYLQEHARLIAHIGYLFTLPGV